MQRLVSDACVLIDIVDGALIDKMFSLPFKFTVPDTLYEVELAGKHSELLDYGLACQSLAGELVAEAYKLKKFILNQASTIYWR